jgi:hypothetical protein
MAGYPWRYDDFTHAGRKDTIVIGLLTPAEAVAPQGMALNTIEVGVTVIGSAVVAVPFMVALATGNSSGASLPRRMTMGQLARLPVAHASAGF